MSPTHCGWPYYGSTSDPKLSLQTLESTIIRFQSGTGIQFWGRTNCTNSTGVLACETGDCGSGYPDCSGFLSPTATTLTKFSLGLGGYDYYNVSLHKGYSILVSVVPVGGYGFGCSITGCIYDVATECPQELVNGSVCQSPCALSNAAVYCCSVGTTDTNMCQPTVYSKLFKQACPRAYIYSRDEDQSTFSFGGSPNFSITFCPTSTTLISEISTPFQPANASALSPGVGPEMEPPPLPLLPGPSGYMAPEYAITGHYSAKSDVYSFGVMVIEIISGQKSRFFHELQLEEALLHRAWRLWNERKPLDLVDTRLNEDIPLEVVTRCFHIGVLCIQEDVIQRPGMRSILDALTNPSTSLPEPIPPRCMASPNNSDQAHYIVPHPYSGTKIITDVYSRD